MKTNVIYQGKCSNVMQGNIPDNSIDLTVTSPPYDNLRDYEGYDFDYKPIAKQLFRVTKEGGVVVWVVADETNDFCESLSSFKQAIYFAEDIGFKLLDTMIYKKKSYPPAYPYLRRYANQFEYMFVFVKGKKPKTFNKLRTDRNDFHNGKICGFRQKDGSIRRKEIKGSNKDKAKTNVWEIDQGYQKSTQDDFTFEHPASFPEILAKEHIKSWSDENDIILDPMCGSGTVLKQAEILNRKWIGIDIAEKYVNLSYKRVGKFNKKYYDELPKEERPKQKQLF